MVLQWRIVQRNGYEKIFIERQKNYEDTLFSEIPRKRKCCNSKYYDVINDKDYEMLDVLEDYLNCCYTDDLITISDSWKYMRMQLAGTTFDFNVSEGIYYNRADRGFKSHDYLGLYKNKSVRAMGKICARITAVETEDGIQFKSEYGEITEERKEKIFLAMKDGVS